MFNANDSSMNGTCNTHVQYSAQKTETNLRIIQEYFQPKIGRKIRIFSLGWKNNILIKKKEGKFKSGRVARIEITVATANLCLNTRSFVQCSIVM